MDANLRAFNAEVPMLVQWDDHEVTNNWSDSKMLGDAYKERSIRVLAANAARAFHEMMPTAPTPEEPQRVYRKVAYGPLLDVFFLDMRTYRGPNGRTWRPKRGGQRLPRGRPARLAEARAEGLPRDLEGDRRRHAAVDRRLGRLQERKGFEAVANNENGKPLGRELEFAALLKFIKDERIVNTVWLTADVHYTAAHYYNPKRPPSRTSSPSGSSCPGPSIPARSARTIST